jgi:hypothetical protein
MVACAAPAGVVLMGGTNTTVTGVGTADDPLRVHAATVGTGLTPRGPWSNLVAYAVGDIVSDLGTSWVAQQAGIGPQPSLNEGVYWTKIAQKGDTGTIPWRGPWSNVTAYLVGDLVAYQGSTWRALAAHTGTVPVEGATWTMQVQKGDNGLSELAYAENTVGAGVTSTTAADISGVSLSFVTDGNPYFVQVECMLQLNYATAGAPGVHQATVTCFDTTAGAEIFRTSAREVVQVAGGMLVVAVKRKRFTSAAGVTKNLKMQAFLGPTTTAGMTATILANALYPCFLSAWRA